MAFPAGSNGGIGAPKGRLQVRIEHQQPLSSPLAPARSSDSQPSSTPIPVQAQFVYPAGSLAREVLPLGLALAQVYYFRSSELDSRPLPKVQIVPPYPVAAALQQIDGRVVLRVYIGDDGEVDDVIVLAAEPPGTFDESARQAFASAVFTPGLRSGRAVKSQLTLEVAYDAVSRGRAALLTTAPSAAETIRSPESR